MLNRLKVGTFYKNIYNLDKKDFEKQLEEEEVPDQTQYEIDDDENYEDDASDITGDMELDEEERRMLEMAEEEDAGDIEDIAQEEKLIGKKRKKPV